MDHQATFPTKMNNATSSQTQSTKSPNDVVTSASPNVNINGNDNVNSSHHALAKAISSTLSAVITEFDSKAQDTLSSQDQLASNIDRLTRELDQLLEDAPLPFIMQHAARISGVRKRVLSLNAVLKSTQRRVDNIDHMLSAGKLHEKVTAESSKH